jgi:hypothetical protein
MRSHPFACMIIVLVSAAALAAVVLSNAHFEHRVTTDRLPITRDASGRLSITRDASGSVRVWSTQLSDEEIDKAVGQLHSLAERSAIRRIFSEIDKKPCREIFFLKLAPELCQEIECYGAAPDTVRRYVEGYSQERVAADNHETALRSAAASERSGLIAMASAVLSFVSLLISMLAFLRPVRVATAARARKAVVSA